MKRIAASLFALLSLGLVLGACSKTNQVEDKVGELMSSSPFEGKDIKVDCPSGVKAKKGEQFDCTVNGKFPDTDTTSARAHITFSDDNSFVIDGLTPLNGSNASSAGETPATSTSTDSTASGSGTDATLPGADDEN